MERGKLFRMAEFFATFGYSGYSPWAPGTVGSLAAAIPYFLYGIVTVEHPGTYWQAGAVFPVLAGIFVWPGIWASHYLEKQLNQEDPGFIVIDEAVGFWLTIAFLPFHWEIALGGLLLFRLLDITKPFPINKSQNLPGGVGVMVDDILAGFLANGVLRLLMTYINFPWSGF